MGGSSLFFLRLLRLALLQDEVNGAIGLTLAEAQPALGLHQAGQLKIVYMYENNKCKLLQALTSPYLTSTCRISLHAHTKNCAGRQLVVAHLLAAETHGHQLGQ